MRQRNARETKRTTLKDIAEESGVSVSTVSSVLSGFASERRISPDVMERVQAVAAMRGFSPNRLVRSIQRGKTHILGFYSAFRNRWEGDLYLETLSKKIEFAAGDLSYDLLILTEHKRTNQETFSQMNGGWADGLILFGAMPDDPLLPLLRRSGLPTVLLQGRVTEADWPRVHDDEAQGIQLLADAVVAQGHRQAAILGMQYFTQPSLRGTAFRHAMARRGVPIPDEYIHYTADLGLEQYLHHLRSLPNPPTVIFAWTNRLGYKLLEACEHVGISVPDQLSIVGYDGIHWPSTSRHILTSAALDMNALSRAAVELLDQLIYGTADAGEERVLPVTLQRGTTLGPVPPSEPLILLADADAAPTSPH